MQMAIKPDDHADTTDGRTDGAHWQALLDSGHAKAWTVAGRGSSLSFVVEDLSACDRALAQVETKLEDGRFRPWTRKRGSAFRNTVVRTMAPSSSRRACDRRQDALRRAHSPSPR